MQIEELKLQQEIKDSTMLKIQDQIKHLFKVTYFSKQITQRAQRFLKVYFFFNIS